jgi:preprotein translocase subunit SecE
VRKRIFGFIGDIVSELRKVNWPSRRELVHLTIIVIIVSVAVGVILWGIDYGFSNLVENTILR